MHRPGLGNLVSEAGTLRAELPLLSTHLPVAEIAEEMRVPRRTIKSRAVSIYRKLGAASRSQAVSRARELELLEG